jgi:hypothetical protein
MQRNHKTEEHKRLRRLYNKYDKLRRARKTSGEWVDVEPYQRGWIRYYVLRDDAKKRNDAREMQQVLDRINTMEFCNNEKFLRRNWKTHKWEPMPQKPKYLTQQQYDELSEKHKSFFMKREWVDTINLRGFKQKCVVIGYVFRDDFYLVFRKEPNMVTQHWIPNQEIESLYGELDTHMNNNNLWTKLNKAMHWRNGYRDWNEKEKPKYRNADGFEFEDSTDGQE